MQADCTASRIACGSQYTPLLHICTVQYNPRSPGYYCTVLSLMSGYKYGPRNPCAMEVGDIAHRKHPTEIMIPTQESWNLQITCLCRTTWGFFNLTQKCLIKILWNSSNECIELVQIWWHGCSSWELGWRLSMMHSWLPSWSPSCRNSLM